MELMFGPRDEVVRSPAVAGMFYPAQAERCLSVAGEFLAAGREAAVAKASQLKSDAKSLGAIVPHAGWVCSGAIAGEAIAAVALSRPVVDVVVVFGAIHTAIPVELGVLDPHARWGMPGGEAEIEKELAAELAADGGRFAVDERFHRREHAVEVELPLICGAWKGAKILPIEMPPNESAVELGETVAKCVAAAGLSAVYLASSDLTHYGPDYGYTPAGIGEAGLEWAKENDRRLLDVINGMRAGDVVIEAPHI